MELTFINTHRIVVPKVVIEMAAQTCHEANRAHNEVIGLPAGPTWEEASIETKVSACMGVEQYCDNPVITPEESHQSWMDNKREMGWKYGLVKCEEAKTHPCMKPYDQLSFEQRCKDAIFLSVAKLVIDRVARQAAKEIMAREKAKK